MFMFNDILWKSDDQNCISNAEKVKNYAKRFQPGHLTFLGPGSENRWYGDSQGGQWDRTANQNGTAIQTNWSSYLHKYQFCESRNLQSEKR